MYVGTTRCGKLVVSSGWHLSLLLFSGSLTPLHTFPLISQVVYKLTDFGYAKSYDKSSVCTSLVGMVQYVASVCTSLVGTVQYVVSVHMVDIVLRLFRLFGCVMCD